MSVEKVVQQLKKYDMDKRIITFNETSATVSLAASRLGCEEARIAKTLSFKLKDKYILIVTCGNTKIDNKKYKQEFGEKAHMLESENVETIIGHQVGGVCPFGVNDGIEIYFDNSLKKYETVYPACGSIYNAIEISISELEKVVDFVKWIDVCKSIDIE